jgi:hypothetical protein
VINQHSLDMPPESSKTTKFLILFSIQVPEAMMQKDIHKTKEHDILRGCPIHVPHNQHVVNFHHITNTHLNCVQYKKGQLIPCIRFVHHNATHWHPNLHRAL